MDNGEALEAYIEFKADDKQLSSTIQTATGKVKQLETAGHGAETSLNKVWATKSGAASLQSSIAGVNKELSQTSQHASKAEGGLKHFLEQLKQSGGRRSALGETVELFRGGGAVMAVSMIGEALKNATEKMNELDEAFQRGTLDASGMAVKIGEALPVIGGFVSAGQSIQGMLQRHANGFLQTVAPWIAGPGHGLSSQDEVDRLKIDSEYQDKSAEQQQQISYQQMVDRRRLTDRASDTSDKAQISTILPERLHRKAEVDLQFKVDTRSTDEELSDKIHERQEQLSKQVKELNAAYDAKPHGDEDQQRADNEQRNAARNRLAQQAKTDIDSLTAAAGKAKQALADMHDKSVQSIMGITEEMRKLVHETEKIGQSKLDQFKSDLAFSGMDPKAIDELAVQKAKEIGAILHQSLLNPMEKWTQEMRDLNQLRNAGGVDKQTYQRAQYQYAHDMLSSVKSNSVEGMFVENLHNRFIDQGINSQVAEANRNLKQSGLPIDDQHKLNVDWQVGGATNTDATKDNTDAVQQNTDAQSQALQAMKDLGQALKQGQTARFGA